MSREDVADLIAAALLSAAFAAGVWLAVGFNLWLGVFIATFMAMGIVRSIIR